MSFTILGKQNSSQCITLVTFIKHLYYLIKIWQWGKYYPALILVGQESVEVTLKVTLYCASKKQKKIPFHKFSHCPRTRSLSYKNVKNTEETLPYTFPAKL